MRIKVGNTLSEDRFALELAAPTGHASLAENAGGRAVVTFTSDRKDALASGLGYIAETFDRGGHGQGVAWTAQNFFAQAVYLYAGEVITNLLACVSAAPGTPGNLNHAELGIYTVASGTTGTKVAGTADASTAFQTTGMKSTALATAYTVPASGVYHLGVWFDQSGASGMPTLVGAAGTSAAQAVGANALPHGVTAAQATMPASPTLAVTTLRTWIAAN